MTRILALAIGLALCSSAVVSADPLGHDIAQTSVALDSHGSDCQETNFGDLMADAVCDAGHTQIGVVVADEIADAKIPAGPVSADALQAACRYAGDDTDTVVVLSVTGAQLLAALERGVSREPQTFDGFLQVSGLRVRYDPQSPSHPVTATIAGGDPIVATQTYRVATTHLLATGSLGYFSIWGAKDIVGDTNDTLGKVLDTYVETRKAIRSVVEGRITPSS